MSCTNSFELIQLQGPSLYKLTTDFMFACNSFGFMLYNRSSQRGKSGLIFHGLVTAQHVADANSQNKFTVRLSLPHNNCYMKPVLTDKPYWEGFHQHSYAAAVASRPHNSKHKGTLRDLFLKDLSHSPKTNALLYSALLLLSSLPTISSSCHSICSALLPSASTQRHWPALGLPTLPSSAPPAHETTGVWMHQGCEPNTARGAVDDFSSPPSCPTASFHRSCAGSDYHHVLLDLACESRALTGSRFPEEEKYFPYRKNTPCTWERPTLLTTGML